MRKTRISRPRPRVFEEFVEELQDDLNPGVTKKDAIEMLAQHMVTGPVFDALFGEEAFTARNPVGRAMQTMLDVIRPSGIDAEAESLEEFYESVRRRAKGAGTDEARQRIIAELYDKFFRNAFAETSARLGIVYTPVEVVDFILRSVAEILESEFGAGLGGEGVHILDPFAGTGTFITRLLQSGLIGDADLARKYAGEIHANEIVLLAYYIASVNIETAFHGIAGGEYRPFERICLADTFNLNEGDDLLASLLTDNSDRRTHQKEQDIRVIVGNPPWMARQKDHGYPQLYKRIKSTYAARSTATLKNSLYDSYKLAIRWASDRIGEKGVIGFVTNGSWLDGNVDTGIRACFAEEFTSVHVLNLRGNARTSGELRRTEGDNVFDQGSRAPVAIMILVRNPAKRDEGCRILYRDIGDCLTREEKLEIVSEAGSIAGIDDWQKIAPDRNHDWIGQREPGFDRLCPLGSKAAKKGMVDQTVFRLYSNGYKTGRDAWLYNFSRNSCLENARLMIEDYRAALAELGERPSPAQAKAAAARHKANVHWDDTFLSNLKQRKHVKFTPGKIRKIPYRPFVKQNCYVDDKLVQRSAIRRLFFPDADAGNRAICVPGVGSTKPFSALMVDAMPDLELISKGQCFPRYRFEKQPQLGGLLAEEPQESGWVDNISDAALERFRMRYGDPKSPRTAFSTTSTARCTRPASGRLSRTRFPRSWPGFRWPGISGPLPKPEGSSASCISAMKPVRNIPWIWNSPAMESRGRSISGWAAGRCDMPAGRAAAADPSSSSTSISSWPEFRMKRTPTRSMAARRLNGSSTATRYRPTRRAALSTMPTPGSSIRRTWSPPSAGSCISASRPRGS